MANRDNVPGERDPGWRRNVGCAWWWIIVIIIFFLIIIWGGWGWNWWGSRARPYYGPPPAGTPSTGVTPSPSRADTGGGKRPPQ